MTEELSGRRIVVPETRELSQLVRMLEERGAEAVPCPMIAIRDAPDPNPSRRGCAASRTERVTILC
jgi:uroporphyrinogen-III synthase